MALRNTDLMVGDWVNLKNGKVIMPCRITVIGHATQDRNEIGTTVCVDLSKEFPTCIFDMDVIIPIPLTPEILEKNGFEIYEQDFTSNTVYKFGSLDYMEYDEYYKYFDIGCKITYKHFVTETTYIHSLMRIRYVHELQHALRLCGIEKTIEL